MTSYYCIRLKCSEKSIKQLIYGAYVWPNDNNSKEYDDKRFIKSCLLMRKKLLISKLSTDIL